MVAVTVVFALASGDNVFAVRAGVMLLIIVAVVAVFSRYPATPDLQVNESLIVVALTFLVGSAGMVWPLMADGLDIWDALFESVSALTTTGLTTVVDLDARSAAFLFARAWMQWCGGFFIAVVALALIVEPGPAARRLLGTEGGVENLVEGTRQRVRQALAVYAMMLAVGMFLLLVCGLNPLEALLHSLSSVSTGGFSSHGNSIADFSQAQRVGVIALTVCGATPLALYAAMRRQGSRPWLGNLEMRVFLLACLAASVVMIVVLRFADQASLIESIRIGPLLAFSAQTTSGFEATRVSDLSAAARAALLLPMFIGGNLGSTAGGIKIVRFIVVVRVILSLFRRARMPRHAVFESTPARAVDTLGMVFLFGVVIAASWLPLLLFLESSPLDSLFEVVSAVGTVGLSSGLTSTQLPLFAKGILCVDMLMGRLEIIAIVLLFTPSTWIGRRTLMK